MKNKSFFLISAAVLLALSACGGNKNGGNKGGGKQGPTGYVPEPYVDPVVNLSDVATPNMRISFSDVEDNCMVAPRIKQYVDAMNEQEKTLEKPYHFSALYGPDDMSVIGAAPETADGKKFDPADTGGVDVCQYLTSSNGDAKNHPIKLEWSNGDVSFDSAKLKFWSTENQEDIREISLGANATSAELPNLFRARKYRVQLVTDDGQVSQGFEFTTADYPRTITLANVNNVRDLGGYITSYGVRTNQGLIYRGYYIDDKSGGHGVNWNSSGDAVQKDTLHIGYELDLQKTSETNGRTTSCLEGAEYKCLTLVSYDDFLKESSYKNLPEVMKIIANSDEQHTYFHCYGGADRTGMLAFFINAICGVSYTGLIEDFEITTETNNKRCHMHNARYAHFPKFLNEFINNWSDYDKDLTVNKNCENWLTSVAKVDPEDIEKIRGIMLPGYSEGKLSENALIPEYTAGDDWETDDLAHWQVSNEDPDVKCNWGRHKYDENGDCVCGMFKDGGSGGSSSSGNESDFNEVLTRVWTKTADQTNSSGKPFEQIKDNSRNKVGVRILTKNISAGSFDSDYKIPADGSVTYKITAPKAGAYQMVMSGRVSAGDSESKTLSQRGISIKLNGTAVTIDFGDRTGNLGMQGDNNFVICPTINLTGEEDTIEVVCKYYRVAFSQDAWVVFAEH